MSLFKSVVDAIVDDYDLIGLQLRVKFDPRSISWHGSMWCRWAAESNMVDMTSVFSRVTQGTVHSNPWYDVKLKKHLLERMSFTGDGIRNAAPALLKAAPDVFCKGYTVSIDGHTYPDILHEQEQRILLEKMRDHKSASEFEQTEFYHDAESHQSDQEFIENFDLLIASTSNERLNAQHYVKRPKLNCHYSRLAHQMLLEKLG